MLSEQHLKESSWLPLSDKAKVTEAEIKSSLGQSTLKPKEPQSEILALHPKPFSEQNDCSVAILWFYLFVIIF